MYQPRRVSDPVAPEATESTASQTAFDRVPRRALPTLTDRVFTRGGVALAVVTASATAGAVVIGGSGNPAEAVGAAPAVSTSAMAVAPKASVLRADTLTVPLLTNTKVAGKSLVSVTPLYTTSSINVRATASEKAKVLGTLKLAARVSATAAIKGKYRQIEYGEDYGWVLASKLSRATQEEEADPGTTLAPCSRGSAIEGKLRKDTIHIYRSVCARFPGVNSYGGWRAGGRAFHKNGRALDIMITPRAESALGHRIANYLIAHAKEFNVDHIIFEQHIWTPSTPRWRKMANRGSSTANHMDHVHVAIRG